LRYNDGGAFGRNRPCLEERGGERKFPPAPERKGRCRRAASGGWLVPETWAAGSAIPVVEGEKVRGVKWAQGGKQFLRDAEPEKE